MLEKSYDSYYIIPLPAAGIPSDVRKLIESTKKRHGKAFVNLYQTPDEFRVLTGKRPDGGSRYVRTNFYIEISNKPLKIRDDPSWPLHSTTGDT